jgi:hypothetical protein
MKYLGIAKRQGSDLKMPDSFQEVAKTEVYEAIVVDGDILLLATPLDRERVKRILDLTDRSLKDHRQTLEGLAR